MSKSLMPESKKLTRPEHWLEWFEMCAVARCSPETQLALGRFASERFRKLKSRIQETPETLHNYRVLDFVDREWDKNATFYWRELESAQWFKLRSPQSADGAQANEAESVTDSSGDHRAAVAYKKFVETKAAGMGTPEQARDFCEAKATHAIWDYERWLMRPSLELRLPPETDEDDDGDLKFESQDPGLKPDEMAAAQKAAQALFACLKDEHRLLLLAELLGRRAYDDPQLLQLLGVAKSQAYSKRNEMHALMKRALGEHDLHTLERSVAAQQLFESLKNWARPEKSPGHFLLEGENQESEAPGTGA
jgi:hypothetical protein